MAYTANFKTTMHNDNPDNTHLYQNTRNFVKAVIYQYPWHVAAVCLSLLMAACLEIIGIGALIPVILDIVGQNDAMPEIVKNILNNFHYDYLSFNQRLLVVLIFIGARGAMVFLSFFIIGWISTHIEEDLRRNMMRTYLEASWPYHLSSESGGFVNGIMTQTNLCAQALMQLGHLISGIIMATFLIAASLSISFSTFIIFAVSALPYLIFSRIINNKMRKVSVDRVLIGNRCASEVMNSYHLKKYIKASSLEQIFHTKFSTVSHKLQKINTTSTTLKALISTYPEILGLSTIIILIAIIQSYGLIAAEDLIFFILLLYRAYSQIGRIQSSRTGLISYIPSFSHVNNLLEKAQHFKECNIDLEEISRVSQPMHIKGSNVTISYNNKDNALSAINFEINPNNFVALVGRSGAGKTTLADSIMGLLLSEEGEILIDKSYKLDKTNLKLHRERIGYVPQEPLLITGTIKENILLGAKDTSDKNMKNSAAKAMVSDFVNNLPNRYDTYIGDKGISLSGGQKQRIALARALARKPDLLILDEATSALDNETEKNIQEAISALKNDLTIIVIAHRLSTVKNADLIYVMDKGEIIQSGIYATLAKEEGAFKALYSHEN